MSASLRRRATRAATVLSWHVALRELLLVVPPEFRGTVRAALKPIVRTVIYRERPRADDHDRVFGAFFDSMPPRIAREAGQEYERRLPALMEAIRRL